jgi:dual specificity phosphatase 12
MRFNHPAGKPRKEKNPPPMAAHEPAPADAHEILPRLWLGNAKASMDDPFLRQNQIQVVFNCTKNYPFSPSIPIPYRVPVDDNLKEEEIRNMELWSSEVAYRILSEYQQGRTILVHCAAGIQRSAASVAFFLIAYRSMHTNEAIAFIQSRRPIAFRPRPNFLRAIESFDRRFHSEILPELQHSHYE